METILNFSVLYEINQILKKKGPYTIDSCYITGEDYFGIFDISKKKNNNKKQKEFEDIVNSSFYVENPELLFNIKKEKNKISMISNEEGIKIFTDETNITLPYRNIFENRLELNNERLENEISKDIIIPLDNEELLKDIIKIEIPKLNNEDEKIDLRIPSNFFFSNSKSQTNINLNFIRNENDTICYIIEEFPKVNLTLIQRLRFVVF